MIPVARNALSMARIFIDSKSRNQYIITYNLYTGNGFWKDQSGFHIDAILDNGNVIPDILGGRIDFDLTQCYYGKGKNVRIPETGNPRITSFDFTAVNVSSLRIRVDPAFAAGWGSHC